MLKYIVSQFVILHLVLVSLPRTSAQASLTAQNVSFASTVQLTQQQQLEAGLNDTVAGNIETALNFERSNLAHGPVSTDPFYRVPQNASAAPAGSLLKLEINANTSAYTLPPNTALSRILYQTKALNGSLLPASAYILWPYSPRMEHDGYPVIGWAHGTSGGSANCGPSNVRNLWYQFSAPFTLALQGYVVVAPDYLGLGVDHDVNGNLIRHPYLANPSHANDLFYSVEAAQKAFKSLSRRFVMMGHSQGGGAAWGAAQRQFSDPVDGYLGTIAGSPVTDIRDVLRQTSTNAGRIAKLIANSLPGVFPSFNASSIFTEAGLKRNTLITELQGCNSVDVEAFVEPDLFQPDWLDTHDVQLYFNMTANGNQAIQGPMLILQGEGDQAIVPMATDNAVNKTCEKHPKSQLQYITYPGVGHVPALYAGQVTWLDWIADRFAGKPVVRGCQKSRIASDRPYSDYQVEVNWFLEYATAAYEVA